MDVLFKELEEKDLPEVLKIYNWYIQHSTATFHTEPVPIDQLKEFIYINHPLYKSFLIYQNNDIAGYCFLTHYKQRQAYDRTAEVTIYLKPEFCSRGIGKAALVKLEQTAKNHNIKNLIGVISGDNHESIGLFEKSNFVKYAHFKNVGEKFNKILDVVAYQKEI